LRLDALDGWFPQHGWQYGEALAALANLTAALVVAWLIPLALDRFLFRWLRSVRGKGDASGGSDISMPGHPRRAALSFPSLLLLVILLAGFGWEIMKDRTRDTRFTYTPRRGPPVVYIRRRITRGFPWTYGSATVHLALDPWGAIDQEYEGRLRPPAVRVDRDRFVLDLAFALIVSLALALASERFVFSRMRRSRST
jgi:hypothetical protein